jgi:hypothetical protein
MRAAFHGCMVQRAGGESVCEWSFNRDHDESVRLLEGATDQWSRREVWPLLGEQVGPCPQPWALFLQRWSKTAGGTGRVRSD